MLRASADHLQRASILKQPVQATSRKISHLVFDLGGVIVELRGAPILNEWTGENQTPVEIWKKWLTSKASADFESGKTDQNVFASMIVVELSLSISCQKFLDYFTSLPIGPYPNGTRISSYCSNR